LRGDSIKNSIVILCFIFCCLLFCLLLLPSLGGAVIQYSAIFELMALSIACIFAVVGVLWYDPFGGIMAFIVVVVSACEFAVLLSQSIPIQNRTIRSGSLALFLFSADYGWLSSCAEYFFSSIAACGVVASTAVGWVPVIVGCAVPVAGVYLFMFSFYANYGTLS
jgi:NADH:ubiquinone oxidoreductase subunit K